MKKIINLITIIFIVISIIASSLISATAIEIEPINTTPSDLNSELYANQIIFEMVEASNLYISQLYISQGYSIQNSTQKIFFAFDNTICVGYLLVNCINSQYYSSFTPKQLPIISNAFLNDANIAFILHEDAILAITQNNIVFDFTLEQLTPFTDVTDLSFPNSMTPSAITLKEAFIPTLDFPNETNRTTPYSIQLDVPFVGVGWSPNGTSLCWASAVCSIAAYRLNDSTPMTARQLYDALLLAYPEDGIPRGTDIHVMNAFMYFNLNNFNLYDCGLTSTQVYNALEAGRPIFVGMGTSDGSKGHAVALCGISRNAINHHFYTVMDHQLQKVVCHQPTNGSFAMTIGSTTYTNWQCAVW